MSPCRRAIPRVKHERGFFQTIGGYFPAKVRARYTPLATFFPVFTAMVSPPFVRFCSSKYTKLFPKLFREEKTGIPDVLWLRFTYDFRRETANEKSRNSDEEIFCTLSFRPQRQKYFPESSGSSAAQRISEKPTAYSSGMNPLDNEEEILSVVVFGAKTSRE